MSAVPHLVQYQGSKRLIAEDIIKYIPEDTVRLIEPFSGTCAVSILAAQRRKCSSFWLNDINGPLIHLIEECVNNPQGLSDEYSVVWNGQFLDGQNNIDYFYKIRDEFNSGARDAARMLFLLARVVKGAVRYNSQGEMNQSCDKRRCGTKPTVIQNNAHSISRLLKGKASFTCFDYRDVLKMAMPGDLVYMDPPYQGTSNKDNTRDNRYIQGVDFDEFVEALADLKERNVDFIVSYDGMTGDRRIGYLLPDDLCLTHIYVNAGLSAQALLNGKKEITYESLYLSPNLKLNEDVFSQLNFELA